MGASLRWTLGCLALLALPASAQDTASVVAPKTSTTGHYNVSWKAAAEEATFEVQEASDPSFAEARTIYTGRDLGTTITGRLDGTYYYRVRVEGEEWSAPVAVEVAHHSLARAFAFLAVGAFVFLATAALIVGGHIGHRRALKSQAGAQ